MRSEPTILERRSGEALLKKFAARHKIEGVIFGDRPDLTFFADGNYFAVEITSLLPSDVHHAIKTFFAKLYRNNVSIGKMVIPIEPDMWIKAAIERKWKSVQKYDNFSALGNLNLLIHPPGIFRDSTEYDENGFINALMYGHAKSNHGFRNVFYWSGSRIVPFFREEGPLQPRNLDLTNGYPASIIWSHTSKQSETKEALDGKPISFDVPAEHTKIIKPMTPEFIGLPPLMPKNDFRVYIEFGA